MLTVGDAQGCFRSYPLRGITRGKVVFMDVELSSLRGVPLLRFWGEIGNECCPRLRRALEGALQPGADRLLLDFSAVPYLDGGSLGLMWVIFESMAEPGWLGIIGANEHIQRLIRVVGLESDDTVRLFSTQEEAERALDLSYAYVWDRRDEPPPSSRQAGAPSRRDAWFPLAPYRMATL